MQRSMILFSILLALVVFSACGSDSNDTPTPVAAPTITAPIEDAVVGSPVLVTGTGLAGATIDVTVSAADSQIGTGTSAVDGNGNFSVTVDFTEQDNGTELVISVTQSTSDGRSEAVTVSVTQGLVPDAPSISSPEANDEIDSPVTVTGSGEAGLSLTVELLEQSTSLAMAEATVGTDGNFSVDLSYTDVAPGTELSIRAYQSNALGDSAPTSVSVTQFSRTLSGTVEQTSGSNLGDKVYVRLYPSAQSTEALQSVTIDATSGILLPSTPYSFDVGRGTYFVRAFRDIVGPDEQPTLPGDPQSVASSAVIIADTDMSGTNLSIVDASSAKYYYSFNVYAYHESGEARTPELESPANSGNFVPGSGQCRGFYMFATALISNSADEAQLSAPTVKHPSGDLVVLKDDGACDYQVADNTGSSYDEHLDDQRYSYGWADPTQDDAGDYVFSFRDTLLDFIHVEVDNIETVTKLDRTVALTSPTGASASGLDPSYTWNTVAGAVTYYASIWGNSYSSDIGPTLSTSGTATTLIDDTSYRVTIQAVDMDTIAGDDYDARVQGMESYFVTDSGSDSSITISGSITNNTSVTAPIAIRVRDEDSESSVYLDAASTAYSLVNLTSLSSDSTQVSAFLDADGTGDPDTLANSPYRIDFDGLDGSANITQNLVFNEPVLLTAPAEGATAVGDTPAFSWQSYANSSSAPTGAWAYGFFVDAANGSDGIPDILWALPSTATSFDFASPPAATAAVDLQFVASCIEGGGVYDSGTGPGDASCTGASPAAASNPSDLSSATDWTWGMVVLECDFADYTNNTDLNTNDIDDFIECVVPVLQSGGGLYARSVDQTFSTD
ncbi:MAG: hypothetical protein IPJ88_12255 [Myxococcales bacterium]|nr:MAG: hypothetical protein IPJ88_12255 [Myxococcales bacterium]